MTIPPIWPGSSLQNHIPAETPPGHVPAAVAACHAYDWLPMPDDLDQVEMPPLPEMSFAEFLEEKGEIIKG